MRLICGFVHLDGRPAEPARLDAMVAAMVEPGLSPVIARRVDGPAALARLDFSRAAARVPATTAPLATGPGALVLAADARLDEGPDGRPARGTAADAVLVRALAGSGHPGDALAALPGDFALAAWDPRTRTLTCARDEFGIRPLFTVDMPGRLFAFASLPRALHASGLIERRLEEAHLVRQLLMARTPTEGSLFAGVGRLAPGSWLRLGPGRREAGHFRRHDPPGAGTRRLRPEEAAAEMAALVDAAVRRRLPADGPVAAHLSGGLDSGAVTVLAARALRGSGRPLLAYPFLPGTYGDYRPEGEEPQVRLVLDGERDLVTVPIRLGPARDVLLPRTDGDQVMPFDPADPDTAVCLDAAARGAEVLLSGWGGDQAASHNGRAALAEGILRGRWRRVAAETRALAAARGAHPARTLWGEAAPRLVPAPLWRALGRASGRMPTVAGLTRGFLRAEALAGVAIEHVRIGADDVANRRRLVGDTLVTLRAEEWALTAARTGLAVSFPLLDRAVVAFALSLPSELFLRGGVRRRLFRDAMAGILPDGVRHHRGKRRPFPELHLLVGLEREALLGFLAEARDHAVVDRLVDVDAVEAALRTVPTGEEALRRAAELERDGELLATCVALHRVLRAICHLRQHH